MASFPMSGGCFCGAVRFTIFEPPQAIQHCHCEICRKTTGVFFASGAIISRKMIRIEGSENLGAYRTSPSFERQFCKTCGCALFAYEDSETDLMYFSPATLDGGKHPGHSKDKECHIYLGSKCEWEEVADSLTKYQAQSPDEIATGLQKG